VHSWQHRCHPDEHGTGGASEKHGNIGQTNSDLAKEAKTIFYFLYSSYMTPKSHDIGQMLIFIHPGYYNCYILHQLYYLNVAEAAYRYYLLPICFSNKVCFLCTSYELQSAALQH